MAWKILLPQEIMSEGRKLLEDAGHTIIDGRGFEPEDVLADFKEYQPDAMIVRITPISREIIESNPNLKVIVRHGAGFDALDVKACHDNNVQALYAPVANSTSVAETAMLLILEMSRNVTVLHKTWVDDFYKAKLKVRKNTINGKTLGLIGCGNIGSRVAKRALGFEMNVMAYDPYKPACDFPEGVEVVRDLDRIFKECDYVSLHCPNTPVTKNMVNKERLAMMKPTAFLINTARGGCVDETALYEACRDGIIAGARPGRDPEGTGESQESSLNPGQRDHLSPHRRKHHRGCPSRILFRSHGRSGGLRGQGSHMAHQRCGL